MIDLKSGELRLDSGDVVSKAMPESDFLLTGIGGNAERGSTRGDHQWYTAIVQIAGESWNAGLGFKKGSLLHVSLSPYRPQASWSTFSEDDEKKISGELQKMLELCFPGASVEARQSMHRYTFPWGVVAAGVVPQDATASIAILYKIT